MARPQVPKCTEGSWAQCQPRTGNVHGSDDSGVWRRTCGVRLFRWQLHGTRRGHRTNAEQTRQKERGGRRRKGPELWSAHSGHCTTAARNHCRKHPWLSSGILALPYCSKCETGRSVRASESLITTVTTTVRPTAIPTEGGGGQHGSAKRKGHRGETRAAVPTPEHEPPSQRA
jgi:hypothetical protein